MGALLVSGKLENFSRARRNKNVCLTTKMYNTDGPIYSCTCDSGGQSWEPMWLSSGERY